MSRIAACFKTVRQKKRGAFIPYIESGDPDYQTALNILKAMPHAGADLIEIGIPFSDPMADGPTVQAAANRSLKAGTNMQKTLQMVRDFRQDNQTTPIILMGYVNPIEHYGYERFCQDAEQAGVDGLIIVDMPHEELGCILPYAGKHHLDVIRLVTPVTPKNRLEKILKDASGFIYYVSITGVTGTKTASQKDLEKTIPIIRSVSDLPIAIGFGISTAEHVQNAIKHADAAVVASALLKTLESTLNQDYHSTDTTIEKSYPACCAPVSEYPVKQVYKLIIINERSVMSWLTEYVRPRIQGFLKKDIPDNLWTNCDACDQMLLIKDLQKNMNICPHCGHHMRASVKQRLEWTFDQDSYTCIELPKMPVDPLNFRDKKRYTDRLKENRTKSQLEESIAVAHGTILEQKAVVAVMAFEFMAGTMGAAFGEGFLAATRLALLQQSPLIIFTASGGARMQEGMISLMQMPRTVIAVEMLKEAKIPYIVVFTNPTTGGVTASFAMLGDIHIAEPNALIGFAGPRVIENTVHEKLPEGFQRSEYLLDHGMIDMVVKRTDMRETLANLISLLCNTNTQTS